MKLNQSWMMGAECTDLVESFGMGDTLPPPAVWLCGADNILPDDARRAARAQAISMLKQQLAHIQQVDGSGVREGATVKTCCDSRRGISGSRCSIHLGFESQLHGRLG